MLKEIGSEFWDIPTCRTENTLFPSDAKWFLSGRTALKYIIQDADFSSVSMPQWCCESMIDPFLEAGVGVRFYSDVPDYDCDAVFLIDYFGYRGKSRRPAQYKGIVIRDVTHSIFSCEYQDGDYYFGSLRKWAGFWTGGFAFGNWKKETAVPQYDEPYVSLRKEAMEMKKQYIEGKTTEKSYLAIYEKANERLKTLGICGAHPQDIDAAKHLDIGTIKTKRRRNAELLLKQNQGMFDLGENDCPLFVPVLSDHRNALRKYLIDHAVYCPVHWPRWDLNGKELSLVCDQRYDEEDMNRICECINEFRHM